MIAVQEELDWEVYRLYGLIEEDLTYAGDEPAGVGAWVSGRSRLCWRGRWRRARKRLPGLRRHGSTPITEIPAHWPADYRELVQRRLDLIESHPFDSVAGAAGV